MKNYIKKIFNKFLGIETFQPFYNSLFLLSLKGLNYGNGIDFKSSGELYVLKYIFTQFQNDQPLTIFDVGANVGNYSKELSNIFQSKALIHSFEPSKNTFDLFLQTTKNIKQIIPNNFGFSDIQESKLLFTDATGSGLASIYNRKLQHFGLAMDKSEKINLSTIDVYCKLNKIDRIHFLKLDIEGHELSALMGATQMINSKKIDFIQFEFGGCNIDSRTYFQDFYYFLKDNYRIYRILKNGLYEIDSYKETLEIFITVNYLAIKKSKNSIII